MPRYRLTRSAKTDLAAILRTSEQRHGRDARIRYAALLIAAMRRAAADPRGAPTADRGELGPGLRSLHLRHSRGESHAARVASPVHVLYYRATEPGVVEIVRVLHERMEPSRHVGRGRSGTD